MWRVSDYNDIAVKTICYDCGSKVSKKSYNYFRRANFRSGQAASVVWCKVWYTEEGKPVAFYYAYKCMKHARLIEIAVRTEHKMKGVGKMLLFDLLCRMKRAGLNKLTFRTPMNEEAKDFWLHVGARIVDVKGEDYEMEITIK